MAFKDYYAILMVHPQAEQLVIEAAYKRLAREYHPDRGASPSNHEKMIAINEAFAVLSNPSRRRTYDRDYAQQLLGSQLSTATAAIKQRDNPASSAQANKPAHPLRESVSPVQPDPAAYGIDVGYLARAREGALAWQLREDRIPLQAKWLARAICALIGVTISFVFLWQGWKQFAVVSWLVLLLFGELAMYAIERIRDAHLLRYKYNPLYNPNSSGYQKYAAALAQYEAETVIVYVTRDARFHAQKNCQGMTSYDPMPKWFARLRNAQACPHCTSTLKVTTKHLPPPFGRGSG